MMKLDDVEMLENENVENVSRLNDPAMQQSTVLDQI